MSKLVLVAMLMGLAGVASADSAITITSGDSADAATDAATIDRVLTPWLAEHSLSGHLDVAIANVDVVSGSDHIVACATVRIALSDAHGHLISVLSGTATAVASSRRFHLHDLPSLRDDALIDATRSMLPKLHLPHTAAAPFAELNRWLTRVFTPVATS